MRSRFFNSSNQNMLTYQTHGNGSKFTKITIRAFYKVTCCDLTSYFEHEYNTCLNYNLQIKSNFSLRWISKECPPEVRFASLLSGGFTTMTVINPPDWKLANRTFVHWCEEMNFLLCMQFYALLQRLTFFDSFLNLDKFEIYYISHTWCSFRCTSRWLKTKCEVKSL